MSVPLSSRARTALTCLGLFLAATLPYLATLAFPFVAYDDPDYVTRNPMVQGGLTLDGLRWAFTAAHASNWHPLTWLSHMLDVELFGSHAGGHHATSVLLHGLNAGLCFLALRALTGRAALAAAVALVFAVHPLRVESVAWVSERKDVLAGLFFFLVLLVHARRARSGGAGLFALEFLCLALGLLAKPMLVSVPLVLLALDLVEPERARLGLRRLVLETLPFALLALASALLTVHAQRAGGALNTLEFLPLEARLANAPLSVWSYLGHLLWPSGLAYFHPHRALVAPEEPAWSPAALVALAALGILAGAAFLLRRRAPLVTAGVAWFLVMLLPVIGLVQVGEQALADRYAYLPTVGATLALLALVGPPLVRAAGARAATGLVFVVAGALGLRTLQQVRTWESSRALYTHALAVTARNYAAHAGLAVVLHEEGDRAGARREHEAALALRPTYAPSLYGLGLLAQEDGQRAEALDLYRRALAALPAHSPSELNLGGLLAEEGDLVGAAQCFENVLAREPEQPDARTNLAQLLSAMGEAEAARAELERVLAQHPRHGAAWYLLGELEERVGRHPEALTALERARGGPRHLDATRLLVWILASAREDALRDAPRALALARELATAGREDPPALEAQAAALAANGEFARAAAALEAAAAQLSPGPAAGLKARAELYRQGKLFLHPH